MSQCVVAPTFALRSDSRLPYGARKIWSLFRSVARRLAVMNPALRGIEADFGPEHADTIRRALSIPFPISNPLAKSRLIP